MDPIFALILIGLILFTGFASRTIFKRTGIPDILFLISLGLLIGPILNFIDTEIMYSFIPFFAPIALAILLFEGGLSFNLDKMMKGASSAFVFTILMFLLSVGAIYLISCYMFNWSQIHCLLLGTVLGGTTAASTLGLLKGVKMQGRSKTILNLEATLTDAFTIIATIFVAEMFITGVIDIKNAAELITSSFTTAIVLGIVSGLGWVSLIKKIEGEHLASILTFAFILILYGINQFVGGSGAISVFVFGFTMINRKAIKYFKKTVSSNLEGELVKFLKEIAFLVRTFFFVYIGLLFNPSLLSVTIVLAVLAITAGLVAVKRIVSEFFFSGKEKIIAASMIPKGLAAAVLANYPEIIGSPVEGFTEIVLLTIIFTNIIAATGIYLHARSNGKKEEAKKTNIISTPTVKK